MIKSVFANYKIIEKIGEGGMGTVYKGVDLQLDRPVALKMLHPHLLANNEIVNRFKSEARTLANLNHPNLATLFNFVQYEDTYCMVMEYVDGHTLAELISKEGPISAERTINYLEQILAGLHHAHQQGIIHRDIKPSNIILSSEGRIKIMDFGIARIIGSQRLTRTGMMIGTLEYMSPEQIRGEEGDQQADLYSVGTVAYELLSGGLPYQASSEFDLLKQKVDQGPITLAKRSPDFPPALQAAIMKSIEPKLKSRCASVEEFLGILSRHRSADQVASTAERFTSVLSKVLQRSRAFTIGVAAVLLLMGAIIFTGFTGADSNVPALVPDIDLQVVGVGQVDLPTRMQVQDRQDLTERPKHGRHLKPVADSTSTKVDSLQGHGLSKVIERPTIIANQHIRPKASVPQRSPNTVSSGSKSRPLKVSLKKPVENIPIIEDSTEVNDKIIQGDGEMTFSRHESAKEVSVEYEEPLESQTKTVFIHNNHPLNLQLDQVVSSEGPLDKFDQVFFSTTTNVLRDGAIVIEKGAMAIGEIRQIRSARESKAVIEFRITLVKSATGEYLPLKASTFRELGKHNQPVVFAAGSTFDVKIKGDHALTIR